MGLDESDDALLREVVMWLRFQNREPLRAALTKALTGDSDYAIYELTDGTKSQGEIARALKVAQSGVSNKWRAWRAAGIVYEVPGESGRCCHLSSLASLGVETSQKGATKNEP